MFVPGGFAILAVGVSRVRAHLAISSTLSDEIDFGFNPVVHGL
jgi:hypothetical protein